MQCVCVYTHLMQSQRVGHDLYYIVHDNMISCMIFHSILVSTMKQKIRMIATQQLHGFKEKTLWKISTNALGLASIKKPIPIEKGILVESPSQSFGPHWFKS